MNVAYIRVSTYEQNEARQIAAMENNNIEKFFIEKASGSNANRPKLIEMLNFVREGDTVYIHDFSRLARSTRDLLDITSRLDSMGVVLKSNKENLDTSTPMGRLMLTMIGAINEFELATIHERQKEGIAIAKEQGKYAGRNIAMVPELDWERYYSDWQQGLISKTQFATLIDVSRPTLNRLIERYKKGDNIFC